MSSSASEMFYAGRKTIPAIYLQRHRVGGRIRLSFFNIKLMKRHLRKLNWDKM